ncbi:uncharacterized protein LOC126825132 isoform X2 [Patella vulgata]|nr:uncharacterized protein LOC126825132 isoform X2 [Patella vulgata]
MSGSHVTVSMPGSGSDGDEPIVSLQSSIRKTLQSGSLTDRDSGRPGTISRKHSTSSDLSEESRGFYDYFPKTDKPENENVNIRDDPCPDFDEAVDVESDKSSIESPRSEDSGKGEYNVMQPDEYCDSIEMKTFSQSKDYHASDEDSDDFSNPHGYLYSKQYGYQRLREDNDEYEMAASVEQSSRIQPDISFPRYSKANTDHAHSVGVDEGIAFTLKAEWPTHKPRTYVSTERDIKLKRRSKAQDETDSRGQIDENGNPVSKGYPQMRERPVSREEIALNSSVFPSHRYGSTTSDLHLSQFTGLEQSSPHNTEPKNKIGNKKNKLKKVEQVCLAENVENYVGDKDLEELVKFIEQNDIKENQLKKTNGTLDVKVEKTVKRSKDKKTKTTVFVLPPLPKPGDHIVIDIEGNGDELANISSDMGNSNEKVTEENIQILEGRAKKDTELSKSQDGDKSLLHKGQGAETKSKTKLVKEEGGEKRTKNGNNVKKETKVNGYNHTVEHFDTTPVAKEIEKKGKDTNKKMVSPSTAKTSPEGITNDKKKGNSKLHVDTTTSNEKKLLNHTKSPNDIKSTHPTSPIICKSEIDVAELDAHYIFTDLPVAQVEPEFTVVGKKKKKTLIHGKEQVPFMAGISREFPVTKSKFRDNYSTPVPRSVTPPPIKSRDKNQDFSLSAFPALGNTAVTKEKSGSLEPRRSSIGELPLTGETSSIDDSDIASVKSLPAGQPAKADMLASRFQKSYAKIAAGPKPIGQFSPDASMEDYSEESVEKPKQTVWKGSLTERRHSIGSSPDDNKLDSGSGLTEKSRQKSGSQEVLKIDANSKPSETANIKVEDVVTNIDSPVVVTDSDKTTMATCDSLSQDVKPCDYSSSTSEKLMITLKSQEYKQLISTKSDSVSKLNCNNNDPPPIQPFDIRQLDFVSQDKMSSLPLSVAQSSTVVSSSVTSNKENNNSVVTKKISVNQTVNQVTSNSKMINRNFKDTRSQKVPTPSVDVKPLKNNKSVPKIPLNGRKNKSVVFLDKKRDSPSNIDITFGFDDIGDDVKEFLSDKSEKVNTSDVRTEGVTFNARSFVKVNDHENSGLNFMKPLNNVVNPGNLQPGHVFTQKLLANDKSSGHIVPNYTTAKSLKEHVNLLNGVVKNVQRIPNNPQTLPVQRASEARSAEGLVQINRIEGYAQSSSTSVVNTPMSDDTAMGSPVLDKAPILVHDNKMVIYYGDALRNRDGRMSSSGDSNKFIHFLLSTNNCGKFNHHEAVSQLKRDWDKVMELKSKNPECVQTYGSQ